MKTTEPSLNRDISTKLTRLYILALTAIALFAVVGQSLVQYALSSQISSSSVVNMAGRQRMLSQRITKDLLRIADTSTLNKQVYLEDLEKILPLWKNCHEGLKNGVLNSETKTFAENSATLDSMLADLDPIFYSIYNSADEIRRRINRNTLFMGPELRAHLNVILDNERRFLERQDKIVFQYDKEAKARVERIKLMEYSLLGFTIIVLAFEGFFVFRPAVKSISKSIELLLRQEKKTQRINEELQHVNASLRRAEDELLRAEKEKYILQVNEQRSRSALLIKGQEEERNRIARELHDGLGQLLTTLKLTFENINHESLSSEKERKIFAEGKELISETINEARNISFNLMPSVLSDFGIASALKSLCHQTGSKTAKNIIFEDVDWIPTRLDKNIEIGLYRIAQEALNNAVKYSEADEICIELGLNDDAIELSITDDGIGFEVNHVQNTPTLDIKNGISNMEERAQMIGGTVKIISNNEGTKVYAKIPIKNPKHE